MIFLYTQKKRFERLVIQLLCARKIVIVIRYDHILYTGNDEEDAFDFLWRPSALFWSKKLREKYKCLYIYDYDDDDYDDEYVMMMMMMEPSGRYGARHLPGSAAFAHDRAFQKINVRRISAFSVFVCYYHYYSTLYYYYYFFFYSIITRYIFTATVHIYTLVLTDVPHKRRTTAASWFKSESCRKWWIRNEGSGQKVQKKK